MYDEPCELILDRVVVILIIVLEHFGLEHAACYLTYSTTESKDFVLSN